MNNINQKKIDFFMLLYWPVPRIYDITFEYFSLRMQHRALLY